MNDNVIDPQDRERIQDFIETPSAAFTAQAEVDNEKNAANLRDQIEQTIIAGVSDPDIEIISCTR